MGKVITVWGSPGSGKSMFSCILAKALTRDKRKCWPAGLRAFASACCGRARSFLRPGGSPPRGRPCSRCFPRAAMWARPWGRSAWAARRTGRRRPARCLRGPRGSLGRCARACCWRRCSRCCAAACTRRCTAAKRGPAYPQGANGGAGNRRKLSFQTGTAVCRRGRKTAK